MNWIKIDENTKKLEGEVLAIDKDGDLLIGTLIESTYRDSENKRMVWRCVQNGAIGIESDLLEDVVAYIPTRELVYSFTHNGGL